jgi:endonuclease-3
VIERFDGDLPCDAEVMRSFGGVGPKCTNLALGIACGVAVVSADIHVHRIANRWGIIATKTPEQSMEALQDLLPERYRVEINRLLVPFGKHVCTGTAPRCSVCPVLEFCRQVGVTTHR